MYCLSTFTTELYLPLSEKEKVTCTFPSAERPRIESVHYLNYKDSCGHVTCVSSGSPATSVTWMKDGQPLHTNESSNYTFSQEISDREASVYINVLVVSRMKIGNYTCIVTNDLGSTSVEIIVDSGEFTIQYEPHTARV